MSALPLFDSILLRAAGKATAGDRVARFAGQLVRSAMNELADIESLDRGLAQPDGEGFDPQTAVLLRGMYEEWARDADAVLERVAKLERMGIPVTGAEELRDAQGRLRAMLRVSIEDVEGGRRQFRQGRVWTREEIRGELGLGL